MEYDILEASDSEVLIEEVNSLTLKGWKPLGGIAVLQRQHPINGDLEWWYAQAMVKEIAQLTK